MLFDREAIEAQADAHCKNFSDKDIIQKTTSKIYIMKLLFRCQVLAAFQLEIHTDVHCQNCPLKTTQPFFKILVNYNI